MPAFRLLLLSLLSLPFVSRAQRADPTPAPPISVGVGVYTSAYQPLTARKFVHQAFPLHLTAGYQLRPRLGVQLGLAYSGTTNKYAGAGNYGGPASDSYTYQGEFIRRNVALSALSRCTLTRKPEKRFQVDLLGGFTLERQRLRDIGVNTTERQGVMTSESYDEVRRDNTLLLTVGPSLRYRLDQHFEALVDGTLNYALNGTPTYKVFAAAALGVRYRFGGR